MNARRVYSTSMMHIRTFSREKAALFFTLFFPIMLMVLFGLIFQNTGNVTYSIAVQDHDNTDISKNFTQMLGKVKGVTVEKVGAGEDPAAYMKDRDLNFMLVIDKGFQDTVIARMGADPQASFNLTVRYDPTDSSPR